MSSSNDELNIRDRLIEVGRQGQEPKDRLWAAIAVLALIALLSGGITIIYAETTRNFLDDGRALGFQRGAVDCLQVVIDDDRTFGLPPYCARPEVRAYYPPEVCDEYFDGTSGCGTLWVDP